MSSIPPSEEPPFAEPVPEPAFQNPNRPPPPGVEIPHGVAGVPGGGVDEYIGSRAVEERLSNVLAPESEPPLRRRRTLPLFLFVVTCGTTFLAGCYNWWPTMAGSPGYVHVEKGENYINAQGEPAVAAADDTFVAPMHVMISNNWPDGLVFMVCVMGILLFHEMGHFLMTIRHGVPASYPFFIPFPMMVTGTMGAVISMEGFRANRRELFDIGLAGPLAGLVLTIPCVIVGIMIAQTSSLPPDAKVPGFGDPLLVKMLVPLFHEASAQPIVNPIFMAGWVGMLITGLNMLPISQLDGGHVAHAVLGRYSRWVARGFLMGAVLFIVLYSAYHWMLMLLIVVFIGTDHPPTADDKIDIGWGRQLLGLASLAIPVFCFPPFPLVNF